jgi:D-alanine-D-alanine ligase
MRITVLHNFVAPDAPPEDRDTLVQVEAITEALARLGHEPITLSCTLDLTGIQDELPRLRPKLVFSLVESLAGADSLVYLPAAVLDVLGVPYCGCHTASLFLTTHKTLAKERMRQAGLPTPAWIESLVPTLGVGTQCSGRSASLEATQSVGTGGFPRGAWEPGAPSCPSCSSWIIKGVWDQGSRGLDDAAVLRDVEPAEVRARLVERTARLGRPCFAEQFIEGREFNQGLLAGPDGPELLPPAEIDFSAFPPDKPQIVGHRAKWDEDSFECRCTPRHFDFPPSDTPLLDRLRDLSRQCWTLFQLRGWARVDFRVDATGQPWILEVNSNPCLSPDAGFAAAMQQASIPYDEGIRRIVADAVS